MIFVTVGFHYQGFERLIRKMDEIAGKIDEDVIMQIGSTKYTPKNAEFFDFIDDDEKIAYYFGDARIIVAHAGAGTIMDAVRLKRPLIVVPRLQKFNEHVDDQQLELAEAISNACKAVSVYEIDDLEAAISRFNEFIPVYQQHSPSLIRYLKNSIGEH